MGICGAKSRAQSCLGPGKRSVDFFRCPSSRDARHLRWQTITQHPDGASERVIEQHWPVYTYSVGFTTAVLLYFALQLRSSACWREYDDCECIRCVDRTCKHRKTARACSGIREREMSIFRVQFV